MTVEIAPATVNDAVAILPHLRADDRNEVYWQNGVPAEIALPMSIGRGALVARADGTPVALFGCAPLCMLTRSAAPWMVGTDWVADNPVTVLRHNRRHVALWQQSWQYLFNHVSAENALSVAWLRWLGFTLDPVAPHGPLGKPFHKFWWKKCASPSRS